MKDHKLLRDKLDTVKSVTIVGINPKSITFCSTLMREYPNLEISMIDENKVNRLEDKLGLPITDRILEELFESGVSSYCGLELK